MEGQDVKTLGTGYAELVSIFPSAPVAQSEHQITLGSYIKKRPPLLNSAQEARSLSCGKFLDYGPFTNFAPTFDQDGVEVGQRTLSEVLWHKRMDKTRERVLTRRKRLEREDPDVVMEDANEAVESQNAAYSSQDVSQNVNLETSLHGLLSPEQVAGVKQALGTLELERAIDELMERNARALARLEQLQAERLLSKGVLKDVEVGSEEWDTGTLRKTCVRLPYLTIYT